MITDDREQIMGTYHACGCSHRFPAPGVYLDLLARWHELPRSWRHIGNQTAADRTAGYGVAAPSRRCLSTRCFRERLAGRWFMLMGDSTQRELYSRLVQLLALLFGFQCLQVQPHVDGLPIRDRDSHKDYDTICIPPPAGIPWARRHEDKKPVNNDKRWPNKVRFLPECFGSLYPACKNERLPPLDMFTNESTVATAVVLSMRFLRGADEHKLEKNTRDWRQRYAYTEWRQRTLDRPNRLLYLTDGFSAHPATRVHLASRTEPDVVLFTSGAWDIPLINRSSIYNPYMGKEPCPTTPPLQNVTVRLRESRLVPVSLPPCQKRAARSVRDGVIYADYKATLSSMIAMLRRRFSGRLIVRSVHSGTVDLRQPRWSAKQRGQLEEVNRIIAHVAQAMCTEVLDVYEIDRLKNFYPETNRINFHVPQSGVTHAALAALAMFRLNKSTPVSSPGWLNSSKSTAACVPMQVVMEVGGRVKHHPRYRAVKLTSKT